jgi:hypothetical protein
MTRVGNGDKGVGWDREAAPTKLDKLKEILGRVDALPRLDIRTEEEILGYAEGA